MRCCRPLSTAWGRMSKLRKTHNRYKRCANDGITYRGPIGVCTRTTPAASFSINITWTYLGPEIGQSNSRAAIMHYHTMHCKALFQGIYGLSYPKTGLASDRFQTFLAIFTGY